MRILNLLISHHIKQNLLNQKIITLIYRNIPIMKLIKIQIMIQNIKSSLVKLPLMEKV